MDPKLKALGELVKGEQDPEAEEPLKTGKPRSSSPQQKLNPNKEPEGTRMGSPAVYRRVYYFKKAMSTPPPEGQEVFVCLRDGTFDIAQNKGPQGYYNRKSQKVIPRFWWEFPILPQEVSQ